MDSGLVCGFISKLKTIHNVMKNDNMSQVVHSCANFKKLWIPNLAIFTFSFNFYCK